MRWPVFLIFAWIALALEAGFRDILAIPGLGLISPSAAACLVVFVALFAPRSSALWAAWVLGVLMDLMTEYSRGGNPSVFLIGPYALGYAASALVILQVRILVFRQRILTFALLTFLSLLVTGVVYVAILAVRNVYPEAVQPEYFTDSASAMGELGRRFGIAVYSAIIAIPIGAVLMKTIALWTFQTQHVRRTSW